MPILLSQESAVAGCHHDTVMDTVLFMVASLKSLHHLG